MEQILNRDLLSHNTCFGCGHANADGLRIEVRRDPADERRLIGSLSPTADMVGFPGITHGGVIYSALDCLSTWVATLLGPNRHAAWVLRSASATYHNPAPAGEPLSLAGWILDQGDTWDPLIVRTETRRADGALCVDVDFKVVPLSQERLKQITGAAELPANWRAFLASDG